MPIRLLLTTWPSADRLTLLATILITLVLPPDANAELDSAAGHRSPSQAGTIVYTSNAPQAVIWCCSLAQARLA